MVTLRITTTILKQSDVLRGQEGEMLKKHKDSHEAEQRGVKNRGTIPVLRTDNRFVHYRVQTNTRTHIQ